MTLKELRLNAGLTQQKAAARIGTSLRTYIRWENQPSTLNIAYRERIAKVYNISVKQIDWVNK